MDSDGDRDNESPQRAPRHNEKKRRRSRSRSESDSDEEYKRRRRPYSVNQVQPAPMYAQPQYSMPVMAAPAPVLSVPRMYGAPPPGPHGVFQNILHSILKQNINERLDVSTITLKLEISRRIKIFVQLLRRIDLRILVA
jgi:hypothetical protein